MIRRCGRWCRTHALVILPFLLVIGVAMWTVHAVEVEGDARLTAVEKEAHERCLDRRSDREVLRQLVDISTTSSNGRIDLTKVPGFHEVDPVTQTYLRNLSEQLVGATPSNRQTLHDQMLAKIPPIDC